MAGNPILDVATARTPLDRERTSNAIQDLLEGIGVGRYKARRIAQTITGGESSNLPLQQGLLDLTPIGSGFSRQEAAAAGRPMGPGAPSGLLDNAAIVWHGSPHKFDKFNSAKIGTGEGAQRYGHGLYFAESPDVAVRYRDTLTNFRPDHIENSLIERGISPELANTYAQFSANTKGGARAFDNFVAETMQDSPSPYINEFRNRLRVELPKLQGELDAISGNLYKVDLPDEQIAKMLDWDKPLADQPPFVAQQLERAGMYEPLSRMSSGTLWHDISAHISNKRGSITKNLKRDQASAADAMRELGIPGIRYLDQGSRGAGVGTSNYVVFPGEERFLRILERNGMKVE